MSDAALTLDAHLLVTAGERCFVLVCAPSVECEMCQPRGSQTGNARHWEVRHQSAATCRSALHSSCSAGQAKCRLFRNSNVEDKSSAAGAAGLLSMRVLSDPVQKPGERPGWAAESSRRIQAGKP